MSADLLATVVAAARRAADARAAGGPEPSRPAGVRPGAATRFRQALASPGIRVIAECKRRSPSRGVLARDYDPAAIARRYVDGGAAAISVLTEPTFFDGSLAHLGAVRAAVDVPLLRKDFVVTRHQVAEAAAAGADAVLLIVAALPGRALDERLADAAAFDLAALVEVHDEAELDRALAAGSTIVGVNSRNLRTLEVDLSTFDALIDRIPDQATAVAESGLKTGEDLRRLARAGYDAFLVGERLMSTVDPGRALGALLAEALG